MSYEPLLKRLTELGEAASPGPWKVYEPENSKPRLWADGFVLATFNWVADHMLPITAGSRGRANAALAAPAHEMAACVVALVGRIDNQPEKHWELCSYEQSSGADDCDCGVAALDALVKALGVA